MQHLSASAHEPSTSFHPRDPHPHASAPPAGPSQDINLHSHKGHATSFSTRRGTLTSTANRPIGARALSLPLPLWLVNTASNSAHKLGGNREQLLVEDGRGDDRGELMAGIDETRGKHAGAVVRCGLSACRQCRWDAIRARVGLQLVVWVLFFLTLTALGVGLALYL